MGIKKVNQSRVMIVERLGKYHKQLSPGINFIIPGLDKIKTNINLYTTNVKYNKEHTELITEGGERDVGRTRVYEQVNLAPNSTDRHKKHEKSKKFPSGHRYFTLLECQQRLSKTFFRGFVVFLDFSKFDFLDFSKTVAKNLFLSVSRESI